MNYNYNVLEFKLPRKLKKRFLGNKMSKNRLRKLLKSVEIDIIKPYSFCPHCGCREMFGTGNLTSDPEWWEKFFCYRCNKLVGYIDNSSFVHALECEDNNWDPSF
jgi:transcription initiation factor IIE alpha subunit